LVETIDDLVNAVSVQFRPYLKQALKTIADMAEKSSHASHALKSFETHKAKNTLPPAIKALKAPTIQCSELYRKSGAGVDALHEAETLATRNRDAFMDQAITMKKDEVKFYWDTYLNNNVATAAVRDALDKAYAQIISLTGSGVQALNAFVDDEKEKLNGLCSWYASRAIHIGQSRHQSVIMQRMKKLSVKEKADEQMLDIDQQTLQTAVEAALKKRDDDRARQKKRNSQQSAPKRKRSVSSGMDTPTNRDKTATDASGTRTKQLEKEDLIETERTSRRSRKRQAEEKEIIGLLEDCDSRFRVRNAYSYPDSFCSASMNARISFITLKSPVSWYDTLRRFDPGVHKGPGVSLSRDLEYFLSLNLKHVFHNKKDFSLPFIAFQTLERTVRIRYLFQDKDDDDFIPKFHVPKRDWIPPAASHAIERGLAAGKAELFSQLPAISPQNLRSRPRMASQRYFDELKDANLLSFITDKNLGLAVVTTEWYNSLIQDHLDEGPYVKTTINTSSVFQDLWKLDTSMLPKQMQKFVWHSPPGLVVPQFYGIPKIHKNPWKIRPIVPSHNWITAHVAKIVDHLLHPIMKKLFPWIVESSREVALRLHEYKDKKMNDILLLKGDVKSMYTNVPRQGILEVLQEIFKEFPLLCTPRVKHFILEAVRFVNHHCFFSYNGQDFWQSDGLAMGSPSAPVLANIYMGWYERKIRYVTGEVVYFRYIDDILAIIKTKNGSIPKRLQTRVSAPGLEIEWEKSEEFVSFLDLSVFSLDTRIYTELYEKKLNHFQYIPWSSAHPRPVLKGFIKAELLRFLCASTYEEGFSRARRNFWHHLRARGYPPYILHKWFGQVSWGDRFVFLAGHRRETQTAPLLLPSHYNSVWDKVLISRIRDVMIQEWKAGGVPAPLRQKIVKCLSRTESLYDLSRQWNREILELIKPSETLTSPEPSDSLPFAELEI
jgi:hypothetical protein